MYKRQGLREYYVVKAADEAMLEAGPPAIPRWSDAFVEAFPQECVAWTLRGEMGIEVAWAWRGHARAKYVNENAFDQFFRFLNGADRDLTYATQVDPTDPTPWCAMVTTGVPRARSPAAAARASG